MRRPEENIDGLVVAGLTELAMGALTGWPMALAVSSPEDLPKIGIRSGARLRQWHLDLIMLGSLTAAAPKLVPNRPRKVAVPLAVGAWVNANAFGVLAFRPELKSIRPTAPLLPRRSFQLRGGSQDSPRPRGGAG